MWSNPITLSNVNNGLDRTQEFPTEQLGGFRPGVAAVPQQRDPTLALAPELPPGQIVTKGQLKQPRKSLRARIRELRKGGRWTVFGLAFLMVCWALWAGQSRTSGAGLVLILILLIAVGLFAISRLAGGVILEKVMQRTRRGAVLSHLAIGFFLAVAGFSLLRQVEWVVIAWNRLSLGP